ncbi:MAG: hypothetical protein J0M12_04115 [Deltaproteobacteria bacterium]|nr:hypothetical protein [Deltaproteobacteria bacterium]
MPSRANDPTSNLSKALLRLSLPLVRFALARGFRFQEMVEVLKGAFLAVAAEELAGKNLAANASRLSVLTGLQRKEVAKLTKVQGEAPASPNLLNRIVGRWQTDKRFAGAAGKPRALKFEGAESEFAELVRSVSADTNPYTVLFGLEQSGSVKKKGAYLSLQSSVYDVSKNSLEGLELLAMDSDSLHRAVEENLFSPSAIPQLHITTLYDNVCVDSLDLLRSWLLNKGADFHEAAREFIAKHDKDSNAKLANRKGGGKVRLCTFSFTEPEESHE